MPRPKPSNAVVAATALLACLLAAPALACDVTSATDVSCGPISVNPANPLSPLNPGSPAYAAAHPPQPAPFPQAAQPAQPAYDPTSDPSSPYFDHPVYADGFLGLFQQNPRIIYPAGPPRSCRQGLDCPANVGSPLGLFAPLAAAQPAAYPAAQPAPAAAPAPRHRRRHRAAR